MFSALHVSLITNQADDVSEDEMGAFSLLPVNSLLGCFCSMRWCVCLCVCVTQTETHREGCQCLDCMRRPMFYTALNVDELTGNVKSAWLPDWLTDWICGENTALAICACVCELGWGNTFSLESRDGCHGNARTGISLVTAREELVITGRSGKVFFFFFTLMTTIRVVDGDASTGYTTVGWMDRWMDK